MLVDIRWLPLLLTNTLTVLAIQYMDSLLSPLFLYIYVGASLIISPALLLGYKGGITVVFITSILLDAGTTGSFGLTTPLLLTGFIILYISRNNLKQNSMPHIVIIAIAINAVFFLFMIIILPNHSAFSNIVYWKHVVLDFIVSEFAILFIAPYLHFSNKIILDVLNLNPAKEDYVA